MEICLISLVIRELRLKTIIKHHYIFPRIIKPKSMTVSYIVKNTEQLKLSDIFYADVKSNTYSQQVSAWVYIDLLNTIHKIVPIGGISKWEQ